MNEEPSIGRREFVKKTAYVAPVLLTLKASPSLADSGSGRPIGQPGPRPIPPRRPRPQPPRRPRPRRP